MSRFFRILMLIFILSGGLACSSNEEQVLSQEEEEMYKQQGMQIVKATFKVLSGELKQAMQEGGVEKALSYCKVNAYPLTDSLSRIHQAVIRRVALRNRNPQNAADEEERQVLEAFQFEANEGKKPEPRLITVEGEKLRLYAPIFLKPMCVNCHGTAGENMLESTQELILEKYPRDRAVDFAPGDLRGMWSVTYKRNSEDDKP